MATGGFPEPYTWGRRAASYLRTRRSDYDIIHDNQSLSYGLLALQRWGFPVVATIHHPITHDRDLAIAAQTSWGMRLATRRWYTFLSMQGRVTRGLAHLVTVSRSSQADIARAFQVDPARIAVVPNGIDANMFRPLKQGRRELYRLIATASADAPLKGLNHLLRALASLRLRFPTLRLTLVGRINLDGPTGSLAEELGIMDLIEIRSNLSPSELAEEYARSHVAVVPSLYEGFGLPAGEAMGCGVPVVATTGGALPEVIDNAGLTVPPGDPVALSSAITQLFLDPDLTLRLGEAGRKRIISTFSWRAAAESLTKIYHHALHTTQLRKKGVTRLNGNGRYQPT